MDIDIWLSIVMKMIIVISSNIRGKRSYNARRGSLEMKRKEEEEKKKGEEEGEEEEEEEKKEEKKEKEFFHLTIVM
ncbi:hypothetical protein M8J77_012989 [Diaphorina citri]|nr:hypothetical protein M8J77_012989 [Diaphorina citri]